MSHKKRLCRVGSRTKKNGNYSSVKAWKKAKIRRALKKAGRKAARGA